MSSDGQLTTYTTATQIVKAKPRIADQFEYGKQLRVIRDYMGDHEFYVAELETQVALAQTLPKALKLGDVKTEGKGGYYRLVHGTSEKLNGQTVTRWRQLAAIPAKERQKFYAENTKPTRAALVRWANPNPPVKDAGPIEASKVYGVLLADPPWRYEHSKTKSRKIENQYPTMTPEDLAALSPPAAANCVLYIWATSPMLVQCIDLIEAWGFEYRTCAVWIKDKTGMGYWVRQKHELLLICTFGDVRPPSDKIRYSSVVQGERAKHSQKPVAVYEMIEACYPNSDKYEMFARSTRPGWDSWGNEV